MARVLNFSAGPSALPLAVLERAAKEMTDYGNTGTSVMEMSHRSKAFEGILEKAKNDLRKLMGIPENYDVLFMQGGASTQFAAVPLNLLGDKDCADYVDTGTWANKALKEAQKYCKVNIVASSKEQTYNHIPELDKSKFNPNAAYFYFTTNNTIYGTKWNKLPEASVPLVTDMSSSILSEPVDVAKYGLIYGGAQKNIGPAGLVVMIIRKDLLEFSKENAKTITPTMLRYDICAENNSMYNTPPTYSIYIAGLVFEHLLNLGGLEEMKKRNEEKAALLYGFLDNSKMFNATVRKQDRSLMNVPFVTGNEELDSKCVKEATAAGLINLKGHRSVGGLRASIYNAIDLDGVKTLVNFLEKFEKANG
ncbi:MAG: 3-phosphoserine/phosphohydroxythreonine transaminase [Chitinispirillales bacterium]|jgi:phosphoserine aminotransferase|nr:3-phosphoserine/phosphohydroxythreonine transaminase [Chitinispirillales bacterium]